MIEHNDLYTHFILHIPLECARVVSGMGHEQPSLSVKHMGIFILYLYIYLIFCCSYTYRWQKM